MEEQLHLFNILGPVMIGPSSSHTAGAARIGRVTRRLLGEEVARAEIGFHGSFAKTWRGHGTDRAVVGGLLDMGTDDVRLRNSLAIAREAGMEMEFSEVELRQAHPNTVRIRATGKSGTVIEVIAASVGGGNIEVRSIDGMETVFSGAQNTLVIRHRDMPGMIARVGGVLAHARVNIATMRVSRRSQGGLAMMAIELDGLPEEKIIGNLRGTPGIERVTLLRKMV